MTNFTEILALQRYKDFNFYDKLFIYGLLCALQCRPFRALRFFDSVTQGDALGYCISPLWGYGGHDPV